MSARSSSTPPGSVAPISIFRCAVIGGGAWGTAIADRLARNGHDTLLWAREIDVVESV
ncbi:MAG: hypothetical protein ABI852_22235, partial [Gemmatimonadaceae bacterium]